MSTGGSVAAHALTYGGNTYTWEHGRQLATLTENGTTWSYTYNADGMRTKRTNGTDTYTYVYSGSQLVQMTKGSDTLYFTYGANGPVSITWNENVYYYILNLQGDVEAIIDSNGTRVVTYYYDAWGNILQTNGSMKNTLGRWNPLRYRGYMYDIETGLYYLQSRYYNPKWGRFINADGLVSTGQGFLGNNMFAYCENNPVSRIDFSGYCYYTAGGVWAHDAWENLGGYVKKPDPGYYQGTTPTGLDVYVATDKNYSTPPNAVKVVDKRDTNTQNGLPDPDMQIIDSYKYTNRADQVGIFTLIYKYIAFNPSVNAWKRSESGLYIEWDLHNLLYKWIKIENFKHADFDNNDEHMLINSFKRIFQR